MKFFRTLGSVVKWTAIVLVILVLGGCAAAMISLGNAGNESEEKADQYALVQDQIKMGMNEAQVIAIAGEPEKRTVNDYESNGIKSHTVYLYYGILNEQGAQLVFEDDRLRAINRG